jgi:hypothetical protein
MEGNEVNLGNVKNQIINENQHSLLGTLSGIGREIDRNQLSMDFMNITPIIEENDKNDNQEIS